MRSKQQQRVCINLLIALIVIVILIVWWNSRESNEDDEDDTKTTKEKYVKELQTPDELKEMMRREESKLNFLDSSKQTAFPYNYWYLSQYPIYLQSWKWGKGLPECINPDAFYPYYWPHNGRGWELTGYGRRQ